MEAVTRLLPGTLGNEESAVQDSFGAPGISGEPAAHRLLDCPHYTRPADFRGLGVPEVLLSGDHQEVRRWRRRRALEKTWRQRPELLAGVELNEEDLRLLENIRQASQPALSREG